MMGIGEIPVLDKGRRWIRKFSLELLGYWAWLATWAKGYGARGMRVLRCAQQASTGLRPK